MSDHGSYCTVPSVSARSWGYLENTVIGIPIVAQFGLVPAEREEDSIRLRHPERVYGIRYIEVPFNNRLVEGTPADPHEVPEPPLPFNALYIEVGEAVHSFDHANVFSSEIPEGRVIRSMYYVPGAPLAPSSLSRLEQGFTQVSSPSSDHNLDGFSIHSFPSSQRSVNESVEESRDYLNALHYGEQRIPSTSRESISSSSTVLTGYESSSLFYSTEALSSARATVGGSSDHRCDMSSVGSYRGPMTRGMKRSRGFEEEEEAYSHQRRRARVGEGTSAQGMGDPMEQEHVQVGYDLRVTQARIQRYQRLDMAAREEHRDDTGYWDFMNID